MKFKSTIGVMITIVLTLAGCSSQAADLQTPAIYVSPIFTKSPVPTSTTTFTLTPSPTLSSAQETETAFHIVIAKAMQTQEYYMNVFAPATLQARNVKCKEGFVVEQYLDVISDSNDTWTLFTCSPIPADKEDMWTPGLVDYGTRYTQLVKTDLSKTWTIQHSTFDYSIINRPAALMTPFRWTADGKFLYLFPSYYPGGSGSPESYILHTNINNLYSINLETGEFKLFLGTDQFSALSFSPDDQFLVYSERNKPDVIHIRNIETNDESQIKLNEDVVATGRFVWNPESTKVVFFAGYGKLNDWQGDLSGTAIFVLTLENMHFQKILVRDPRIFLPDGCAEYRSIWLDQDTICLYSSNEELDSWNKFFSFNIRTGAVEFLRPFP